ncbi:MAG: NfeD family protein [Bacteroidetes bacterium]|nr:NfeD family protein [Bacteroidota bacterium]
MESYSNELIWFLFGLIMMLGEIVTPGFVLIFFGVGAWIVALLAWMGVSMTFSTQLFIFLILSITSLLMFRKYGNKYSHGKVIKADPAVSFDDVRGEKALATSDITPINGGTVEFHGTHWNAESETLIAKGTSVEVLERNNLTLKVKPVQ